MLYEIYYWIFKYFFRLEYLLEAIFNHILLKLKGSNYKKNNLSVRYSNFNK